MFTNFGYLPMPHYLCRSFKTEIQTSYLINYLNNLPTFHLMVIACVLIVLKIFGHNKNLPPGPWGFPFVGSLPTFQCHNIHYKYTDLSKKYGKIFSVKLGQQNVVVISDAKIMKEAFNKEEFSGRPNNEFVKLLGGYGIVNTDGHIWREQRRFLHSCLRNFGMTLFNKKNNNHLQARIMVEVESLLETIRKQSAKAYDLNEPLAVAISNVICSILMSVRFRINDLQFNRMMSNIEEGFRLFGRISIINFFPFLKIFPYFQKEFKKITQNKEETHEFFQNIIDNHRETFDENKPRDVLDYYLIEIEKAGRTGRSESLFDGKDHNSHMKQIVADIFTAGMETTKTALRWTMIYMMHYPDVATNVQQELDDIVGRNRLPTYDDLPHLPYTEATMLEVLRKSSVVPLGNPHATTRDVHFRGYTIPKNTPIIPLMYASNNDPELWESPEKFCPERFLNEEGMVVKPDYFIPFGIGRRNCLGEFLARMEIFMFFTAILHAFHLRLPDGHSLPSLEGILGVTLNPDSYQIVLEERHLNKKEFREHNTSPKTVNFGSR